MFAFVSGSKTVQSSVVPVHFLNLAAFIQAHGFDNDIIEIKESANNVKPVDYYDNEIIERLKKKPYKYIGLSSYTTDFNANINLARKIKAAFPSTKIIMGGFHATLRPKDVFLINAPIDLVITGEGEYPLLEYLQGKPIKEIQGVCYKENDEIVINPSRPLTKDMSHLPLPAYEKIDMDYYLSPTNYGIRFMVTSCIQIFTGFGCPYKCTFCASPGIYKAQGQALSVRYKTLDQVIDEINFLKDKYDLESLYFQDDTFTLYKNRTNDLMDRLLEEKIDLIWGAETRANCIDEELVRKMIQAGCVQLDFGVESATEEAMIRQKKGLTLKDLEIAFALCTKLKLRTAANFMLNTPGETEEDIKELPGFMKKIKAATYMIGLTVPFIGTDTFDEYVGEMSIDEYKLYENPYLYGTIIDPRFKLSSHNLPVEKILFKLRLRFAFLGTLIDFPLKKFYLMYFFKSKYKKEIILAMLGNISRMVINGIKFGFTTGLRDSVDKGLKYGLESAINLTPAKFLTNRQFPDKKEAPKEIPF